MSEKPTAPAILSNDTILGLIDLVGQLQRNVVVLRRILVRKNIITEHELLSLTEQADKEMKPLRDQFLEAIERAKHLQVLQNLELGDGRQRQ